MIAELLGPRGFGLVREDHLHLMEQALARRRVSGDENVSDFFAASCAELAIWMQTAFRQLTVPFGHQPRVHHTGRVQVQHLQLRASASPTFRQMTTAPDTLFYSLATTGK